MEPSVITMTTISPPRKQPGFAIQPRLPSTMRAKVNIPIILTWIRIAFIPALMVVYYLPFPKAHALGSALFTLGALTDWLDGYLARRLAQVSAFGAFLDPVADKLMVAVALVLILEYHPTPFVAVPAAVIIGREITISALREWMAGIGERTRVKVSGIGKFKTAMQMISLVLLLYHEPILGIAIWDLGLVLLYLAVFLTLWSMMVYLRAAWPTLRADSQDN
ncbi:CDP-diacylglycerol--glycerol-3-phosphate 3-phosphatidyltransferase [Gammaproteobacteria bacterium]